MAVGGLFRSPRLDPSVPGPHCATCQAYEDLVPCKDFTMSDRFRDWAVGEMRKEVLGQVRTAGLDRMALLKAKRKAADEPMKPGP
jgi:hypothetical protein